MIVLPVQLLVKFLQIDKANIQKLIIIIQAIYTGDHNQIFWVDEFEFSIVPNFTSNFEKRAQKSIFF